jgi:hypothetical protein
VEGAVMGRPTVRDATLSPLIATQVRAYFGTYRVAWERLGLQGRGVSLATFYRITSPTGKGRPDEIELVDRLAREHLPKEMG